jgi:hypothetical protein
VFGGWIAEHFCAADIDPLFTCGNHINRKISHAGGDQQLEFGQSLQ